MKTLIAQLILGTALLVPAPILAQAYSEGEINITGATQAYGYGIDDDDQVVGTYAFDGSPSNRGFVLSQGVVAQMDWPNAMYSVPLGINSVTGIVGFDVSYTGTFSIVDANRHLTAKGGFDRTITGINATGTFVGWSRSTHKGFINTKGVYTNVVPGPCLSLGSSIEVYVLGVNANNDLVGSCYNGSGASVGFARVSGVDQSISVFGRPTFPTGINDSGTIAGYFQDASGAYHGFLLTGGNATQFDFAGFSAIQTQINGINNRGSLTGITYDTNVGNWVGFVAFAN